MAGCKSRPQPDGTANPPLGPAAYLELARDHNARVAKLQTLYARGVIELRWRDADGKEHSEPQIDMDLWVSLPRQTALRADKLGEVVLWLGSNAERYWLFDLLAEERTLYLGRHDQPLSNTQTGALDVRPLALLDLLGLMILPEQMDDSKQAVSVRSDAKSGDWIVEAAGSEGAGGAVGSGGASPLRVHFDPVTRLPKRVEVLNEAGEIVLSSTLGRYESASKRGSAIMALPKMPHLIDITAPVRPPAGPDARPAGEVKIAINETTCDVDEAILQRVFDLDRLKESMRPEREVVEGEQ